MLFMVICNDDLVISWNYTRSCPYVAMSSYWREIFSWEWTNIFIYTLKIQLAKRQEKGSIGLEIFIIQ